MSKSLFDIDIDVAPKTVPDRSVYGTRAMVYNKDQEKILPHPSGVYLEKVPIDELTGLCAFDYRYGDKEGYIKADILNNSSYNMFSSKDDVLDHLHREPNWDFLKDEKIVSKLPHIGTHYEEMQEFNIRSVEDLADFLAIIRPGKFHLKEKYLEDKKSIRPSLYKRPSNDKAFFKKSHAISYALMIVTVMNKMNIFGI